MSQLVVFADTEPAVPLSKTHDALEIATRLRPIGVRFERWESPVTPDRQASSEEILKAYEPYLKALMGELGVGSADVVRMSPQMPNLTALRTKFLNEHTHTDPEIRFFVHGRGNFFVHADEHIYLIACKAGDLIFVPAHTRHWFDAGEAPDVVALRVFSETSGWVAFDTGDDISHRFLTTREMCLS